MTLDQIQKLFKFSWSQAFSDQNGKSSIVPIVGTYLCVVGGIGFLHGLILKVPDSSMYGLGFATLGAGLLGYHKKVDGSPQTMLQDTTSITQELTEEKQAINITQEKK